MAKDDLAKALANAESKKVHTLNKEKEPKGAGPVATDEAYYYPPTLYLDDKDFTGVEKFKVGDTVHLAIACEVRSISTDDNGKRKSCNANLVLRQIMDITPRKGA